MEKRTVYFSGDVNTENIRNVRDQITSFALESRKEEITLFVTSTGGASYIAIAFYDFIRTNRIRLRTIALGEVSSSALLIFLAGEKRIASPHTVFCFHELGRSWDQPIRLSATDIRQLSAEIEKDQQLVQQIISKTTGMTIEKVTELIQRRAYIRGEKAKEYGLVHEIIL